MPIKIREATKNDVPTIMEMLIGVAEYTKVPDKPKITLEDLYRDGGFDENNKQAPLFVAFLAEDFDETDINGSATAVGLALCCFIYTWAGKTIFLEDLFVMPSHRSRGIGKLLFKYVLEYAKSTGHNRVEFYVVDWNPAKKLYEQMNAVNDTLKSGVQCFRLYKDVIDSVE